MKIEAKCLGRPAIDKSLHTQCGKLTFKAECALDGHILSAIYRGICSEDFPYVLAAVSKAAKQIEEEHKQNAVFRRVYEKPSPDPE